MQNSIRIIGGFLFFFSWLITNHYAPWNTFHQEFMALAGLFLIFPWKDKLRLTSTIKLFAIIWITIISIQLFSDKIYFGDFIFGIGATCILCMAYLCGTQDKKENNTFSLEHIDIFYTAILAASLGNSIIGLAQWQGVAGGLFSLPSPTGRVYGNLAQPNQLATLILLGIISIIHFYAAKKINTFWTACAALILSFTLAATESRTGALSFTILIVVIFLFGKDKSTFSSLRWLAPVFGGFWLTFSNWTLLANSTNRTGIYFNPAGRFDIWEQMLIAIRMKPWLGWGWLNLGEAQYSVMEKTPIHININIDHSHNIFIDLIVWFGIPIGLGFITIFFFWLLKSIKYIQKNPQEATATIAFLTLVPIAIHSLLEYPFAYIYFLIPIGFSIGIIEKSKNATSNEKYLERNTIRAIAALTTIISIAIAINYMKIEKDFFAARIEKDFFTKDQDLHIYSTSMNILTQYESLIKLAKSNENNHPTIEDARKTSMRFPWLSNYKQYYVELLRNRRCLQAQSHINIIEKLFGEFGVLKSEEAATYAGLKNNCTAIKNKIS